MFLMGSARRGGSLCLHARSNVGRGALPFTLPTVGTTPMGFLAKPEGVVPTVGCSKGLFQGLDRHKYIYTMHSKKAFFP